MLGRQSPQMDLADAVLRTAPVAGHAVRCDNATSATGSELPVGFQTSATK
jgi:hypothetical protein